MKKFIFIMLFVSTLFGKEEAGYLFQKGNELYKDAEYKQAIDVYQSILDNDYESAELYYNLGNAYYKLRDIGRAILYYERARQLAPNDPDISHNLKLAELRIVDRVQSPPSFLQNTWQTLHDAMPVHQIAVITLGLWLLLSAVLVLRFLVYRPLLQKWLRFILVPVLIMFSLFLFFFIVQLRYAASHEQAIVIPDKVEIKSSPAVDSQTVFALHKGVKVLITDQEDRYYRIKLRDGKIGWLIKNAVEKI